jgi:hypothetical protein
VGGYYGLLQRIQQTRNLEANLAAQSQDLARLEALFQADRINAFQVDQLRQNVQTTRSDYLNSVAQLNDQIETFLTGTLGLPPDLPVRFDESPVANFQFIDPRLTEVQSQLSAVLDRIRSLENPTLQELRTAITDLQALSVKLDERFAAVREDLQRLDGVLDRRLNQLATERERKELLDHVAKLREDFADLEKRLTETYQGALGVRTMLDENQRQQAHQQLTEQTGSVADLLLELSLLQAGIRLEAVVVEPLQLDPKRAFQVALANRLDLMNQRAQVVDQWRFIAIQADQLESDLDVEFSGEMGTLDRNIARFRNQTGRLAVGVQFDAPLDRLRERNLYRQSLIDYQRARRQYIQAEDQVKAGLLTLLRRIEQFQEEMELRRGGMRIAIRTVDNRREDLRRPPRAGLVGEAAALPPTAVRDLLGALADLQSTQNSVLATYLNYELLRMQLYRDLGVIQFDHRGVWIDDPLEQAIERAGTGQPDLPPDLGYPATPAMGAAVQPACAAVVQLGFEDSASADSDPVRTPGRPAVQLLPIQRAAPEQQRRRVDAER